MDNGQFEESLAAVNLSTGATPESQPKVHDVFDPITGTWQYIVSDPSTLKGIIIDPVLDFDPVTQRIQTKNADTLLELAKTYEYHIDRILETHAHADHITAASYLQSRLAQRQGKKPLIGIGKRISQVQGLFAPRYGVPAEEYVGCFDTLFNDDDTFSVGNLTCTAIHLPGHTPDHMGYYIGGRIELEHLIDGPMMLTAEFR